jgi:hypothetical protein
MTQTLYAYMNKRNKKKRENMGQCKSEGKDFKRDYVKKS